MGILQYQNSTRFQLSVRGFGFRSFVFRQNTLEFRAHALHHAAARGGAAGARSSIADVFEVVIDGEFLAGFDRAQAHVNDVAFHDARDQTRRRTHR